MAALAGDCIRYGAGHPGTFTPRLCCGSGGTAQPRCRKAQGSAGFVRVQSPGRAIHITSGFEALCSAMPTILGTLPRDGSFAADPEFQTIP